MLTRRLFLAGAVAAPAIVRASSLMPLWVPPERKVVLMDEAIRGDVTVVTLMENIWREWAKIEEAKAITEPYLWVRAHASPLVVSQVHDPRIWA